MFSIGEFSQITSLSIKTLRFYHEKGILVPTHVDEQSGYRYYGEKCVERARIIVALRDLRFSLAEITEILAAHDDESDLVDFFQSQRERIEQQIQRDRQVVAQLDAIIKKEREAKQLMSQSEFTVEEKALPPLIVAGTRMQGRYRDCGQGFSQLYRKFGRYAAGKPMCLYYDAEYREDDANFEPCAPLSKRVSADGFDVRELAGGKCVALLHRGPYEQLGRSYEKILAYIHDKGYQPQLPSREVYLKGPGMIFRGNPKKYLTEIQILIEE